MTKKILKRSGIAFATFGCFGVGAMASTLAEDVAGPQCSVIVSSKNFMDAGNKLEHIGEYIKTIRCYHVSSEQCRGRLEGKGLIDQGGNVSNVEVVSDTLPEIERSQIEAEWMDFVSHLHYKPPVMNGQPVCLAMRWAIEWTL